MNLDNNELINLINEEVNKNIDIDYLKLYKCFSKCLVKTIIDIYKKFKLLEDFDFINSLILGTNMFHNVFWILMLYSNNIKLTIFLSERSVLLFTEFILMSRESHIDKDLYFKPTITDAISFSYKKTIGPIVFNKIKNKNYVKLNKIRDITNNLKMILQNTTNIIYLSNLDIDIIDQINSKLYISLYNLLKKNNINKMYDTLSYILNKNENSILNVFFIKIFIELVLENQDNYTKICNDIDYYYDILESRKENYNENNLVFIIKKIKNDIVYQKIKSKLIKVL